MPAEHCHVGFFMLHDGIVLLAHARQHGSACARACARCAHLQVLWDQLPILPPSQPYTNAFHGRPMGTALDGSEAHWTGRRLRNAMCGAAQYTHGTGATGARPSSGPSTLFTMRLKMEFSDRGLHILSGGKRVRLITAPRSVAAKLASLCITAAGLERSTTWCCVGLELARSASADRHSTHSVLRCTHTHSAVGLPAPMQLPNWLSLRMAHERSCKVGHERCVLRVLQTSACRIPLDGFHLHCTLTLSNQGEKSNCH